MSKGNKNGLSSLESVWVKAKKKNLLRLLPLIKKSMTKRGYKEPQKENHGHHLFRYLPE
jgi:hypothetical protein